MADLCIGLMSGTSLDGVDGVVVDFSSGLPVVQAHAFAAMPAPLCAELLALNTPGGNELHRAALAANALAGLYAGVVQDLLRHTGLPPFAIGAIGAHGQTVRHRPGEFDGTGYTLQLNNPALLAERTGIPVAADFRSRDVAAGGQGAPLVPAFHHAVFGREGETVRVLNLGGIANLSVLDADGSVAGFDCGPGNALLDHWCLQHTGRRYDASGAWSARGKPILLLLLALLAEPFLQRSPPKSTGRDLFNPAWLDARLAPFAAAAPVDVQATLAEFTARSCADAVQRWGGGVGAGPLIVCGGGACNDHVVARLQALLPALRVASSTEHGLPPLQVEAAAFAWLAWRRLRGEPGNLPRVTGAAGERVLGALYPA
ncbi:anhydro-N-acetylmuramic acid kinase [Xylophilus sp.]|uniref:anhydro-N-acetylmuramic acid kinase n=1 Tax=Xylophilus sp. TaxID=2653893 RepID=UPI0013B752FA|nr:anhydro-N-acetylmuramic acid kinase [Xylophilus sp.]KAF1046430.1 MAG: Anhydro-N-acetylmuramic acid kinase [Xylophilus sp.]